MGGFQGKDLTVFLQTVAVLVFSNTLARVHGTCYWVCSISDGDGCIAQLVEQLTLNQRAVGSNPTAPTNTSLKHLVLLGWALRPPSQSDAVGFEPAGG